MVGFGSATQIDVKKNHVQRLVHWNISAFDLGLHLLHYPTMYLIVHVGDGVVVS